MVLAPAATDVDTRSASEVVLTPAEAADDAERMAGGICSDDRMHPVRLAGAARVFDSVAGAIVSVGHKLLSRMQHVARAHAAPRTAHTRT